MLVYQRGKLKENEIHPLPILSKLFCRKFCFEKGISTSWDKISQQRIKDMKAGVRGVRLNKIF